LKYNNPSASEDQENSTMDPSGPAGDSHPSLSAGATQALDRQALREWFHLPKFNQRDGLDDYDGEYRVFDPLGKLVTAHLRHRIRRRLDESPDKKHVSRADPHPEAPSSSMPAGSQRPPAATGSPGPQEQRPGNSSENESLRLVSRMLSRIRTAALGGVKEIWAFFCAGSIADACLGRLLERLPENVLAMGDRLPVLPGPEAWLGALAMGACRVILVGYGASPVHQNQLRLARAILAGLDLDPGTRLVSLEIGAPDERMQICPAETPLTPAGWEPAGDKRALFRQAAEHLHAQVPGAPDQTPLEPGAPFGAVRLDASHCTLCMACVGVCSTHALRKRDCTQCGRCRQVCPEEAVTLFPRICYDPRVTGTIRTLHQDAPMRCSVCGVPYATAGMVAAVTSKLAAHWMYQDPAARERLTMCRDCRIRSCFATPQPPPPRRPARRKK
jgi:ferredoxin